MEAFTSTYVHQAVENYENLKVVINRPKRDMVPLAILELVKKSMTDFLVAYLVENGWKIENESDLLKLQHDCSLIDPAFGDVNLESIAALADDENMAYSSELEDAPVYRYVDTLEKIRDMVIRRVSRL